MREARTAERQRQQRKGKDHGQANPEIPDGPSINPELEADAGIEHHHEDEPEEDIEDLRYGNVDLGDNAGPNAFGQGNTALSLQQYRTHRLGQSHTPRNGVEERVRRHPNEIQIPCPGPGRAPDSEPPGVAFRNEDEAIRYENEREREPASADAPDYQREIEPGKVVPENGHQDRNKRQTRQPGDKLAHSCLAGWKGLLRQNGAESDSRWQPCEGRRGSDPCARVSWFRCPPSQTYERAGH